MSLPFFSVKNLFDDDEALKATTQKIEIARPLRWFFFVAFDLGEQVVILTRLLFI